MLHPINTQPYFLNPVSSVSSKSYTSIQETGGKHGPTVVEASASGNSLTAGVTSPKVKGIATKQSVEFRCPTAGGVELSFWRLGYELNPSTPQTSQ